MSLNRLAATESRKAEEARKAVYAAAHAPSQCGSDGNEVNPIHSPNCSVHGPRLQCHCGKDGHALRSINCPVHGTRAALAEQAKQMTRELAKVITDREVVSHVVMNAINGRRGFSSPGFEQGGPSERDVVAAAVAACLDEAFAQRAPYPWPTSEGVSSGEFVAESQQPDAAEGRSVRPLPVILTDAILDERGSDEDDFFFDPRPKPSAACYDFEAIADRAKEIEYDETPMGFTDPLYNVPVAYVRHEPRLRPAGVFNFDAIRYHRNVMHGDDITGTMWSNPLLSDDEAKRLANAHPKMTYDGTTPPHRWPSHREHSFDHMTDRCEACLWPATLVQDNIAPRFCEGRAPKGEPCIRCGEPHVVMLQSHQLWCLSCGNICNLGPIPDRGAVRFEQRMKERAASDWAKAKWLEERAAKETNAPPCTTLTAVVRYPGMKAAIQALVDTARAGIGPFAPDRGPAATPCLAIVHDDGSFAPRGCTCAVCIEQRRLLDRANRAVHPVVFRERNVQPIEYIGRPSAFVAIDDGRAEDEHPEGCMCDVCIPF